MLGLVNNIMRMIPLPSERPDEAPASHPDSSLPQNQPSDCVGWP